VQNGPDFGGVRIAMTKAVLVAIAVKIATIESNRAFLALVFINASVCLSIMRPRQVWWPPRTQSA
jgi:hypothetical protein